DRDAAQLRALCRPGAWRGDDAGDGLRDLGRDVAFAAAGGDLPRAAHAGRPTGDAADPRPTHAAFALGADPGPAGVRLVVGHRRPVAGGAAAGLREARVRAHRWVPGLGTAARVAAPYNGAHGLRRPRH